MKTAEAFDGIRRRTTRSLCWLVAPIALLVLLHYYFLVHATSLLRFFDLKVAHASIDLPKALIRLINVEVPDTVLPRTLLQISIASLLTQQPFLVRRLHIEDATWYLPSSYEATNTFGNETRLRVEELVQRDLSLFLVLLLSHNLFPPIISFFPDYFQCDIAHHQSFARRARQRRAFQF